MNSSHTFHRHEWGYFDVVDERGVGALQIDQVKGAFLTIEQKHSVLARNEKLDGWGTLEHIETEIKSP
jgi:hypothetical protein